MPKNQPTAAKRARAAARTGAKYTEALRAERGHHEHHDDDGAVFAAELARAVTRWDAANDAAASVEESEREGRAYDEYRAGAALDARAAAFSDLAAALAEAARRGEPVTLDAAAVRVLAIAAQCAELADEAAAARHRIQWGIPTLFPRTEIAKLALIRCEGCGHYWQPGAEGHCTQCPRLWHGPTPGTQADAVQLPKTLITRTDLRQAAPVND